MNRLWLIVLISTLGLLTPVSTALAGGKPITLTITHDTLRTESGRLISGLRLVSNSTFYATIPSGDGRFTFFVMRDYIKSVGNWASIGKIVCYSHESKSIHWQKETNSFNVITHRDRIIVQSLKSSRCFTQDKGILSWEHIGKPIVYVENEQEFGITSDGKLIDLITGKIHHPDRQIPLEDGINEVVKFNDRTLISAAGLTLIDREKHITSTPRAVTGFISAKKVIGNTAILLAAAGSAGVVAYSGGAPPVFLPVSSMSARVTGLTSNVWIEGNLIYQAYADKLVCYDEDLTERWITSLGKSKTGASLISRKGDSLLLINKGIGYLNGKPYRVSKPEVLFVDPKTGRLLDSIAVEVEGAGILQVIHEGSELQMLTQTEELSYSLTERRITRRVKISQRSIGLVNGYADVENIYQCPTGFNSCESLKKRAGNCNYIGGAIGFLLLTCPDRSEARDLAATDHCVVCYANDKHVFLKCANDMKIVDSEGKVEDTLAIKGDVKLNENWMLLRESGKKSMRVLDMAPLCENNHEASER